VDDSWSFPQARRRLPQHHELVALRVEQLDGPGELPGTPDVRRPKREQSRDLGRLIRTGLRGELEAQPVAIALGPQGGPPQEMIEPPRDDRIAVSSSWSHTSGQPSASLQK
jgi:hypothetical protein